MTLNQELFPEVTDEDVNPSTLILQYLEEMDPKSRVSESDKGSMSTTNNLHVINKLTRIKDPLRTLEIGLAFGASALVFLSRHKKKGNEPGRIHVAIDPYQDSNWGDAGVQLIEKLGLAQWFRLYRNESAITLPTLLSENMLFDMIYVDGSHLFENVFIDAFYCARLLSLNGIILFDDSADAHVAKVIHFIRSNWAPYLREIDLTSYYPDYKNKMRYKAAHFFNKNQLTGFELILPVKRAWNARLVVF